MIQNRNTDFLGKIVEGNIQLPFDAPFIWVMNGDAKLKQVKGAPYFGGWATTAEDFDAICEANARAIPTGWAKVEMSRGEKDFGVYHTRYVSVAPFAARRSWFSSERRSPEYFVGARAHLQLLAWLGFRETEKSAFSAWGPVVLSAKGLQVGNILRALGAWDKHTRSARAQYANKAHASAFWMSIGTFGDKPLYRAVGKEKQSTITPIEVHLPASEKLDERMMEFLYVGDAIIEAMRQSKTNAAEWLAAWKTPVEDKPGDVSSDEGSPLPDEAYENMAA